MKKLLIVPLASAALLIGCGDSGMGSSPEMEYGTDQSPAVTEPSDPGVAAETPGTAPSPLNPSPSTGDPVNNSAIGSSIAPSVPVPEQFPTDLNQTEPNSYEQKVVTDSPDRPQDQEPQESGQGTAAQMEQGEASERENGEAGVSQTWPNPGRPLAE